MDDPHAAPPPDAVSDTPPLSSADASHPPDPPGHWPRWLRRIAYATGAVIAIAVIAGGVIWWLNGQNFVTTSDAQIDGYITQLAPQVAGRVTQLLFTDNQHVTAGQPLLKIDPRDYAVKLRQAEAGKASAQAQVTQARAQLVVQQTALDQDKANLRAAQAALTQAQQDYQRDKALRPRVISQQTMDQATEALRSAKAKQDAAQQAVQGAQAQIKAADAHIQQAQAAVRQAGANVATAKLQLSYCTIVAPVSGTIGHRTVAVGDYVNPGQALFAIVQDQVWVTADFKETQLAAIKPGDPVNISVDAVPGITFHGKVQGFQPGTGSIFSVLPAENATGNYVKVVQRVPVRIAFDDKRVEQYRLLPGESVEPAIRVH
ncbi:MAG TPA: HlyD family secretion protein [Acetobacteraceae bacterium]|nr:HlyD family secretion protein [Acetobacteraceae bacterium]